MPERDATIGTKLLALMVAHEMGLPLAHVLEKYVTFQAPPAYEELGEELLKNVRGCVSAYLASLN
jgi:hypothetical protein